MDFPIILLVLLFAVVVHECAHGLAAEYFGDPTARQMGRLTLNPIHHIDPVGTILVPLMLLIMQVGIVFAWAKPVPVNGANLRDPARHYPLVAAAGPASNFLLALICAVLLGLVEALGGLPGGSAAGEVGFSLQLFLTRLLQYGVLYNVLLAVFNLIPLPPLDGSWIIRRFLSGSALAAYESIRPYGFFILILVLYILPGNLLGRAVYRVADLYFVLSDSVRALVS